MVGFVDEDDAAAEGVEEGEDFFEVGFGCADPAVAEVFEGDDGDCGFAGEAFGEEGFAGADGAAEEVAHGECGEVVLFPESEVLAEPGFDAVEAEDIFEGFGGFDEFDESGGVAFDELFAEFAEVFGVEWLLCVLAEADEGFECGDGGSGEA